MGKFIASVALATAVVVGGLLAAEPAKASTYNYSYTGAGVSGFGTLTVTGSLSPYDITLITGIANGDSITGLSTWASADNKLWFPAGNPADGYSLPPTWVSIYGISFTTGIDTWNIYNYQGAYYITDILLNGSGNLGNGQVALDSFVITATPLPSTWMMLIASFAGFGFLAYRGTKKSTALATA